MHIRLHILNYLRLLLLPNTATPWLYSPWNSLGQNTGVGCHSLLQGNRPNPGIKPRSLELQMDSLPAESPGYPKKCYRNSCKYNVNTMVTEAGKWQTLFCFLKLSTLKIYIFNPRLNPQKCVDIDSCHGCALVWMDIHMCVGRYRCA